MIASDESDNVCFIIQSCGAFRTTVCLCNRLVISASCGWVCCR